MQLINLPSGSKCEVIEITDADQVSSNFLKAKVNSSNRYTCLFYNNEVKLFAMILTKEVAQDDILEEIKNNLKTDILILKQLCDERKAEAN